MTETELNNQIERSEAARAELLPPIPKKQMGRAYRRKMKKHKNNLLYKTITRDFRPRSAYVEHSYIDGRKVPTGKYIKHTNDDAYLKYLKRKSNRLVRKNKDIGKK